MALRIEDKWYKTKGQAAEILDVSEYSITQRIKAEDDVEIVTLDEVEELNLVAGFDEEAEEAEEESEESEEAEVSEPESEGPPIIVVEEETVAEETVAEEPKEVKQPVKPVSNLSTLIYVYP